MTQPCERVLRTRRAPFWVRWNAAMGRLLLAVSAAWVAPAGAHDTPPSDVTNVAPSPIDQELKETAKGHGSVSIAYQNTYVNGRLLPGGVNTPIGTVRIESIAFDLNYFFADQWSAHVGIPYVDSRYQGPSPHCPTASPPQCQGQLPLTHPHPESRFLDDGDFHGAWQDWTLGVAYHADVNDYQFVPSVTATIPSHNYSFFANAAVGQDLRKTEVALDLSHQFEFTNLYYRVHLGHVFAERTLGQNIDHDKLDLELGYFLNDTWTLKVFGIGKKGHGFTGTYDRTTELWYHHDQRAKHSYANMGVGLDYHFNDKYILSTTVQRLVWGEFVYDFKYSLDVRLTKEF